TKDGRWLFYNGDIDSIENNTWAEKDTVSAIISPDKSEKSLLVFKGEKIEKIKIDIIFPVMHGKNGEDGTIQGIFEMADIAYVGCTPLAGAMCMDKAITNTICDAANIPQAKWVAFTKYELDNNKVDLKSAVDYLKFPIFVKPANAGSSVGITKAHDESELEKALEIAFKEDRKVVLEETLVGREIECAVMGNSEPVASCIGEILPTAEFYDYEAKYINDSTGLAIPAELPDGVEKKVQEAAKKAYLALNCSGLSRVDFFLLDDGRICLNELNTLPGFTSISMFPKLFAKVGVPYNELIDRLLSYAEEKHNEK
ncbi:MAG: D-alanine--D-alanine ligase, partial [Clostridia bacterium]|nr:D-alanine--D-alanine ligase [Clostridia bacterium]